MSSSAKAKQEELIASLDKFEAEFKAKLNQKLVETEDSIDKMQDELKQARETYASMKAELLTYKGQYTDLEKFLADEAKQPKVCPQCNYPLQNLFKCCPMCGTPIPQAGDPDIDYPIPAGPVVNQAKEEPKTETSSVPPVPPPPPADPNIQKAPVPPVPGQKQFPNFQREADRGDAAAKPAQPQKQFPNFQREADRGDAGASTNQADTDNASGFLSRFGFGKKKKEDTSSASSAPIQLGTNAPSKPQTPNGPLPPPPPPAGKQPARYFPNFERSSDRGANTTSAPTPAPGAPVPPPPPKPPVPPTPVEIVDAADITIENGENYDDYNEVEEEFANATDISATEKQPEPEKPAEPAKGGMPPLKNLNQFGATGETAPIPNTRNDMRGIYEYHDTVRGIVIDRYVAKGYSEVIVPRRVGDQDVIAIAARAFAKNEDVRSITLQEGILFIGSEAFFGCSNLRTVQLPETLDKIKTAAFSDCSVLEKINLPKKMSDIGAYAFANCKLIKRMEFPEGIKWISEHTMSKCGSLQSIVIPDGIRAIENGAFAECMNLEGVDLPMSVVSIGDKAFYGCRALNKVTIPPSVSRLGNRIFFPKMGQSMIPKLTIFCSNGSAIYNYCRTNNIKSKGASDMPETAPTLKNRVYALEVAYWLKDKDIYSIQDLKAKTIGVLSIPDYEVDDLFVEENGMCKELHGLIPFDRTVEEALDVCHQLPQSCYVQVLHCYDGPIDEGAKAGQLPF